MATELHEPDRREDIIQAVWKIMATEGPRGSQMDLVAACGPPPRPERPPGRMPGTAVGRRPARRRRALNQ